MFNLTAALNLIVPTSQVQRATAQINSALNQSTSNAVSFADAVALKGKGFAAYAVASAAIVRVSESFSKATRDAIRFEFELAKIAQTVEMTNQQVKEHAASIQNVAVEYGLSAAKVAETVRVLAQAGYSFKEAKKGADALAATTLLGSFDSIADTTDGLIAVMKQFNLTMADSEKVLGLLNVVSKKYAVESSDIVEAVRKAGGTFSAMGGNLQELISLFTTVRDTTRESAETIATGFRTIFARLARPQTIEYFRELGIELTDLKGNLKSPQQAIVAIQQGLERLGITAGSVKFAEIVEEIGGIRQASRVIPLLTQAEKLSRITQDANGAIGSFSEDVAKAQDTLYYKIINLQQAFSRMVSEVIDTKSFKIFADVLFGLANAAIELARSLKQLLPLLLAVGAVKIGGALRKGISSQGLKGFFFNRGGVVPGTGNSDTVPAMLTPGEFVIRKSAVEAFGADKLHAINKYADGGIIQASSLYSPTLRNKINDPNITPDQYKKGEYINRKDKITFNKVSYGISGVKKVGNKTRVMNAEEFEKYAAQKFGRTLASGVDGNPNAPVDLIGGSFPIEVRNRNELTSDSVLADKFIRHKMSGNKNTKFLANKVDEDTISLKGKIGIVYNTAKLTTDQSKGLRKPRSKRKANGGGITGTDTVPALLTPGEFVVNKRSAEAFGYGNLKKINKYAKGGIVQKFQDGGFVSDAGSGFGVSSLFEIASTAGVVVFGFKELIGTIKSAKEGLASLSKKYETSKNNLSLMNKEYDRLSQRRESRIKGRMTAYENLRSFQVPSSLRDKPEKIGAFAKEELSIAEQELKATNKARTRKTISLIRAQQKNREKQDTELSRAIASGKEDLKTTNKARTSKTISLIRAQQKNRLAQDIASGTDILPMFATQKEDARLRMINQQRRPLYGLKKSMGGMLNRTNVYGTLGTVATVAGSSIYSNLAARQAEEVNAAIEAGDTKGAIEAYKGQAKSERAASRIMTYGSAGATIGTGIGAAIGSAAGGVGAIPGAAIGAGVGATAGAVAGATVSAIEGLENLATASYDTVFGFLGFETYAEKQAKDIKQIEEMSKARNAEKVASENSQKTITQISTRLVRSFAELEIASKKAASVADLGELVNSLGSDFRVSALSKGIESGDTRSIIAAGRITGATSTASDVVKYSKAQDAITNATTLVAAQQLSPAQFAKIAVDAARDAGIDDLKEQEFIDDPQQATQKLQERMQTALDQVGSKLFEASAKYEQAFNQYLDAFSKTTDAQIAYNESVIDFGQRVRDRSKELESFKAGGSTVYDMRSRVASFGNLGSSRNLRQDLAGVSGYTSSLGTQIARVQAAGGGSSGLMLGLQGEFGKAQIALKAQTALIQQDTKVRQQLIDAMKEELELEKQRATSLLEVTTNLTSSDVDTRQEAEGLMRIMKEVEMAMANRDVATASRILERGQTEGLDASGLIQSTTQEAISSYRAEEGLKRAKEMGYATGDVVSVVRTRQTQRGAEISAGIQNQMVEQTANEATLLKAQEDNVKMLESSSRILETAVADISRHFQLFGDRLSSIVQSLQNTSIAMRMEPTNVAISFNNAEFLNVINDQMKQLVLQEVENRVMAMKQGQI